MNGRRISADALNDYPFSALTEFERRGFTLGPDAFTSSAELERTVLQELYRLRTSRIARAGAGVGDSITETGAAFRFAEAAHRAFFP